MILKNNFSLACFVMIGLTVVSCVRNDEETKVEIENIENTNNDEVEEEAVEEEAVEEEEVEEEIVEEVVEEDTDSEVLLSFEIYENIEFAVDTDGLDTKRFFSTSTGTMYTYNEINAEIGPTIDLAWYDMSPSNSGFLFWDSPDSLFQSKQIEGATGTKMENTGDQMTVAEFDSITEEGQLNSLIIEHENEAMGPVDYPVVVLFQNAAGHIGAIKMKSNDGQIMTVDIKVAR
tara:strand:+ start:26143 stop:26838 length:696 start_codon:yes stop_codon:yes gene_type:complete